jgi:hypothetical protein
VARFRLDNAAKLGLNTAQARLLSRLVIGPEFTNYQGGPGQTISIHGALPVTRPASPTSSSTADPNTTDLNATGLSSPSETGPSATGPSATSPDPESTLGSAASSAPRHKRASHRASDSPTVDLRGRLPVGEGPTRVIVRPGMAADMVRAQQAAEAEAADQEAEPELASRAAAIAARIAELVAGPAAAAPPHPATSERPVPRLTPRHAEEGPTQRMKASVPERSEQTTNLADRAEFMRRTAARMAANSARSKATTRRADQPQPLRDNHPA